MIDKELLYIYFNGETTPEQNKVILDWVEGAPENFEYFQQERKYWDSVLIHFVTEKPIVSRKTSKKKKLLLWTSVASSFLLAISASFYIYHAQLTRISWEVMEVASGQKTEFLLPDGTQVWLNSASSLRYPSEFSEEKREVFLDGEAFFEVQENKEVPFLVHTGKYTIQVLGTVFNVYAYQRHANHFETALIAGSVSVTSHTEEEPVILLPNEKVVEQDGLLIKEDFDEYERFLWREGLISFDGESFETLMEKLSIYYGVDIKYPENRYPDYKCRTIFRQEDGIEYAMNVLKAELSFTFRVDTVMNTILIK